MLAQRIAWGRDLVFRQKIFHVTEDLPSLVRPQIRTEGTPKGVRAWLPAPAGAPAHNLKASDQEDANATDVDEERRENSGGVLWGIELSCELISGLTRRGSDSTLKGTAVFHCCKLIDMYVRRIPLLATWSCFSRWNKADEAGRR